MRSVQLALLYGVLETASASVLPIKRDVIAALPSNADGTEYRWQPVLDFDTDGCYNTAAISPDFFVNPGADQTGTPEGGCRDPPQLENSNVYSRRRCNNGVCAIMYEYYFEKDQAALGTYGGGHRHDWENIIVWVQNDRVARVAPSCHDDYNGATTEFLLEGDAPMVVYHKDGPGTHCFRMANEDDRNSPENFSGSFYKSPLVGWWGYGDMELRDTMLSNWAGGVGPKLTDFENKFRDRLIESSGGQFPQFDPNFDQPE